MNDNEKDNETISKFHNSYPLRGLAKFGGYLFSGFLLWCTFTYPMSETMQSWLYVWAVAVWFLS